MPINQRRPSKPIVQLILLILLTFMFSSGPQAQAETYGDPSAETWAAHGEKPPTGPIARHYEPMVMVCEEMQEMFKLPFSNLRLYSFLDGAWKLIPYQLDDRTDKNYLVFTHGPQANNEAGDKALSAKDELIFMVRDSGEQAAKEKWPAEVTKGMEIKLIDPLDEQTAFVYLFYFAESPPEADIPQLLVADDSGSAYKGGSHLWQVQGITNKSGNKLYKTILNEKVIIPKLAGGSGENFVDRMKYRVKVRFLFGVLKLNIDENSFIGEVSQYCIGPLRLSVRNWAQIILPARLKSPKLWAEMYLFETFTAVPIKLRVPFNPGTVITDFRMSMGYDLNEHARGMKFYNSNNLNGFVVDGEPTKDEKKMNTELDEWRCITGPQGSILTFSVWDKGYRDQSKIEVFFIDDKKEEIPPESEPGQMGYFYNQSLIKSLEPRDYELAFYICFPPFFYDPKGLRMNILNEYLNLKQNPVIAEVNGKRVENRSAFPEPMWPKFE